MNKHIKNTVISTAAALTATGGVVMAKKVSEKTYCPICSIKKAVNKARLTQCAERGYNNGVAMTPPMGWSSWNLFRHKISEELIKEIADAMQKSGLADAGYKYVNIDDCWQASTRDADGRLQCDKIHFPSGIRALADYVNERGIKLGIYSSNGTHTCEDYPASLLHERIDAETFASWGVEYFKYDFCHNEAIPTTAPSVIKITLGKPGEEAFIEMQAEHGIVSKGAKIVADEKVESGYMVSNLCGGLGELLFDTIEVPEDGDYSLTIVFRKGGNIRKFLVCQVNNNKEYDCYFPSSKGFTPDGRLQIVINLKKGINTLKFYNPVASRMDSAQRQYTNMGRELQRATKEYAEKTGTPEKPICYSLCEWGMNQPWKWGAKAGNLWRTTHDIKPFWASMLAIYEMNVRLYKYAQIGSWNDPDMLEVGVGKLNMEENKTHFSLWCMMAAPLILGNDVRKFINPDGSVDEDNKVLEILKNKDLIAIDQDIRGIQAKRIFTDGISDILAKPLENHELAVCLFNKSNKPREMSISLAKLHSDPFVDLPIKNSYEATNLWEKETFGLKDKIQVNVAPHGVAVYKIKAID